MLSYLGDTKTWIINSVKSRTKGENTTAPSNKWQVVASADGEEEQKLLELGGGLEADKMCMSIIW